MESEKGPSVSEIKNMLLLQRKNTYTPFLTTKAKPHWFYREKNTYHPYDDDTSHQMEKIYQETGGLTKSSYSDYEIDFTKMTSMKKNASKSKHILRGLWFYWDEKSSRYQPYDHDVAADLETAVQKVEQGAAELKDFKVPVTENPPRFVVPVSDNLDAFKQIRSDESIASSYQEVRKDSSPNDWFVIGYEGAKKLKVQSKGSGGVNALLNHLNDNECQFAYLRVLNQDQETKRTKFIFISWSGPSSPAMKRGNMSVHKASVKSIIQEFAVELHGSDKSELTEEIILDRLRRANY